MAVARGAFQGTRLGLHVLTTTAVCANAASGSRCYATSRGSSSPSKDYMRRIRIASSRDWYSPDGAVSTTSENQAFFRSHNIAIDNGKAYRLREPNESGRLLGKHGIRANFHPHHLVHPYQIEFLDPRGHPLAEQKRKEHLEKHETQPLWSIITAMSPKDKAIVRTRAQRRLRASLWAGLERAGYNKYGAGDGKMIYGTACFAVVEPLRYMNMQSGEDIGDAMVKLLEVETRRLERQNESMPAPRGRASDSDWERQGIERSRPVKRSTNNWSQNGANKPAPRRSNGNGQEEAVSRQSEWQMYDWEHVTHQPKGGPRSGQRNDWAPLSTMRPTDVQDGLDKGIPYQSRRQTGSTRRKPDSAKKKGRVGDAFEASFRSKR